MSNPRPGEPLPGDALGKRLCQTFPYLWKAIVKPNDPDSGWKTLNDYPLRPRELWRLWQDAACIVGVRFDSLTAYGMIDLDVMGAYHPNQNPQALSLIRAALETIGITRTVLTQSSSSGGLHLWLPLPEPIPTFGLATAIRQCLEAQGIAVSQGQAEVFPNCKAYAREGEFTEYQGHRLPLQPATGAQLLDHDLLPLVGGLQRFFALWDQCAAGQDVDQLRQAIAQAQKNWRRRSARRESPGVEAWRTALESEISEGWTDHGQTNHLLKQIACYGVVFQGLKGEVLADYVQRTATNCPGYAQWCRHQHEIGLRCNVWSRAAEGYYWQLGTEGTRQGNVHKAEGRDPLPTNSINQARAEDAQARIRNAFNHLKEAGQLALYQTKTALENAIIKLAKCSKQTTRKYLHLWCSEAKNGNGVCTPDSSPVSAPTESPESNGTKSQKPLPDKVVHTYPYMKGLAPGADSGSDLSPIFPQRGGAGGISTIPEEGISQQPATGRTSSVAPRHRLKPGIPEPSSGTVDHWRYEFGHLVKQRGWSLERVKEFVGQVAGKTWQALGEDDWVLLVYQMRTLMEGHGNLSIDHRPLDGDHESPSPG